VKIVKPVDLSSPGLLADVLSGRKLAGVVLDLFGTGTTTAPALDLVMRNVHVTSIKPHDGGNASEQPSEEVSLSPTLITETYRSSTDFARITCDLETMTCH